MDLGAIGGFYFLGKHYGALNNNIVYAVDNDEYAAKIYNDNHNHACQIMDVRDIVAKDVPSHDILIGGFPCQSFSISAQNPPRLGFTDERGKLFFEMVNILKEKKPRFFIAENVKGILSANKKQAFPIIVKEFEAAGYYVKYKLLNSAEYDVPQKRERVFIIGFRDVEDFFKHQFPMPAQNKVALKMVIDDEANLNEKWFFSDRAVEGMLRVKAKMNKGREQSLDSPCNTISSHLAKVSLNSTDPVLKINGRFRRFTPREAASIQSFPLTFKLDSVSENRQYRAVGNAVPPVLMWYVTKTLIDLS